MLTIITDSVNRQPLAHYTRSDGTGYLTSPSLRAEQLAARNRQARSLGPTLTAWIPMLEEALAPADEYVAHWSDEHGWVAVTPSTAKERLMAELPDLGPAIDHPVFVDGPEADTPIIVGGNRAYHTPLHIGPLDLSRAGIYFHTGDLATFRDGGSYAITGTLVWDTGRNAPGTWKSLECVRQPVRVVVAVEAFDDSSRPQTGLGRPVIISQREPIVQHADGRLQRIRTMAMGGHMRALLLTLVDANKSELVTNERRLGLK